MVLGTIWDAIRFPELDPDPVRNAELWREIRAEQAARRDEALYDAIDREEAATAQARMNEAASQPQRRWFSYMLGNADDDEPEQPEEPDNPWGDWSRITNPRPPPPGPPPLPPSSSSSSGADYPDLPPPPPKRKRETQEEKERREKEALRIQILRWNRKMQRADRLLKRGFR